MTILTNVVSDSIQSTFNNAQAQVQDFTNLKPSKGITLPSRIHTSLMKTNTKKRKPDPISQFLRLKQEYGKENEASKDLLEITGDQSRCYFPTQTCLARCSVDEKLLNGSSGCEEIIAEFRGEIHSFGLSSDGRSQYVHKHTSYLFSYSTQLYSSKGEPTALGSGISSKLVPNGEPGQHSGVSSSAASSKSSKKKWILESILPENGWVEEEGQPKLVPLPSTFRDFYPKSYYCGSNFITYGWKISAIMSGNTKKNHRYWLPILVLPLSNTDASQVGRSLEPPTYSSSSISSSTHSSSSSSLPRDWSSNTLESKIKKGIFFSKGKMELTLSFPPVTSVSLTTSLPFLLSIEVFSNQLSDLLPDSSSSTLPQLPLSGAGEYHPKFELVRRDIGRGPRRLVRTEGPRSTNENSIPLEVEWNDGHLNWTGSKIRSSGRDGQGSELEMVDGLSKSWSSPRAVGESLEEQEDEIESFSTTTSQEKRPSSPTSSFFSKFTDKGKGREASTSSPPTTTSSGSKSYFSTKAIISGSLSSFITPTIDLPKLKTSHQLKLKWKLKGLGNDVEEILGDFDIFNNISTGIDLNDVSKFESNPNGLSFRVLGSSSSRLQEGNDEAGGSWDREPPEDDQEEGEEIEVEELEMEEQSLDEKTVGLEKDLSELEIEK